MDRKKENPQSAALIGERIRAIRDSKGLTQKELAGDTVSRNMLSMIESGKALPSVDTLVYLSEALSVPTGYFFAGEDELMLYSKRDAMENIYRNFSVKDYEKVIEICLKYADHDPEMKYCLALAHLNMADTCFCEYRLATASDYLKEASRTAKELPYGGESIIGLCNYAATLAECVAKDEIPHSLTDSDRISDLAIPSYFVAYLTAYKTLEDGDISIASAIARSGMLRNFHSLHVRGAVSMKSGDFETAANLLDLALSSEDGGFYSKYKLLCDLEICRKNLGDFEMAYSLSTNRMEMLGMFSE